MKNINKDLWAKVYWDLYSVIESRSYFNIPDKVYLKIKSDIESHLYFNIFILLKNPTHNFNVNKQSQ